MKSIYKVLYFLALVVITTSCGEEFLDAEPSDVVSGDQLKRSPDAVYGLLDGAYNFMVQYNTVGDETHDDFGQRSIDLGFELMTNDLVYPSPTYGWFQNDYRLDNRNTDFRRTKMVWNFYYKLIFISNQVLDLLGEDVEDEVSQNYAGQALALRAWSHYNLVRIWQHTYDGFESAPGVPLKISLTDTKLGRTPVNQVYEQIESDLILATQYLEGKAITSKREMNYYIASGILADVYLTLQDYAEAVRFARLAKGGSYSLMSGSEWLTGFQDVESVEWMWGYDHNVNSSTTFASWFSMIDPDKFGYAGLGDYKSISSVLYDAIPSSDIRKLVFADENGYIVDGTDTLKSLAPYAMNKFFDSSEGTDYLGDYIFMRVAEMYFIEAEALARDGDESGAQNVLYEIISTRDPNYIQSTNTGSNLIDEILLHKRIEMIGEGKTFFDNKRLKIDIDRSNSNHTELENEVVTWDDNRMLYQIPQDELDPNTGMTSNDQNP